MSLRQQMILFMMERRLSIDEASVVVKLLEADAKLGYLVGRWDTPAENFGQPVIDSIVIILRGKVLAWMNKYRENHPARVLFTGAS